MEKENQKKKLISIEDSNRMILEKNQKIGNLYQKNGVECPECGDELSDVNGVVLPTNPPKTKTYCESCGYKGSRFR